MLNRGNPHNLILGFFIALPSGVGVALAISASLLPPCVNAGLLWCPWRWRVRRRAYALFGSWLDKIPAGYTPGDLAWKGFISFMLCVVNIM